MPIPMSREGRMSPGWKRSLVFAAIFILAAVTYRVYSEHAGPRFDEGLQKLEADTKKTLPRKVDERTTWVDVKYERTKNIYWFVMDTKDGTVDPRELEQDVHSQLCANADALRTIREKRFSYEFHYVNKAQVSLANFTIAKCP
jgi:hypothetical protein